MSIPTAAPPTERVLTHHLVDATGAVLSSHDADRPLYAASTIKLHVVLAVARAAAEGRLDPDRKVLDPDGKVLDRDGKVRSLDGRVPATTTFTGADGCPFTLFGDHLDPTHPAEGTPISVRGLVTRAIDRSSNEATDHLLEIVGLDAVARTVDELGLTGTRIERKIGDSAALEQGLTNETTAADLARTMLALVGPDALRTDGARVGEDPDEERSSGAARADGLDPLHVRDVDRAMILDALRAQQIPIITTVLAPGVDHGSKSGWVEGIRHDVAFVGDDLQVLAVMTAGMGEEVADQEIRSLARRLLPTAVLAD